MTAEGLLAAVAARLRTTSPARPVVTVTWAQSSDGAIAGPGGAPARLSGDESMTLTHGLRAMHGAILVGIQTVLNDDPQLSVRLVEGPQPRPVVLDSRLRFPPSARLLARRDVPPWIFHAGGRAGTVRGLEERGAVLFAVPRGRGGLDLAAVLERLRASGITSLMVEGGARVLAAFIDGGFADQAVVTVSPAAIPGGVPGPGVPALSRPETVALGADAVTWGLLPAG